MKKNVQNFQYHFIWFHLSPLPIFWIECTRRVGGDTFFFFQVLLFFPFSCYQSRVQYNRNRKSQKRLPTSILGSNLFPLFPWEQEFVGICRHHRNPWLCCCRPLSVSKEMDFKSFFHLIKETYRPLLFHAFLTAILSLTTMLFYIIFGHGSP